MKLANPDGKLIYVIKPKNAGEKDIIFITTRASAEKRGEQDSGRACQRRAQKEITRKRPQF